MNRRKIILFLAAACAVLGILLLFFSPLLKAEEKKPPITAENAANVGALLSDLVSAYETPTNMDSVRIEADLEAIRAVNEEDCAVAQSIADHWSAVYLDPDYKLYLHQGEEKAEVLAETGIPDSKTHAIVVLGYELQDGEMQPELKGRCEAAAAVAREFPKAILVCSGGATGANNPQRHTEAGLMKAYLTKICGIEESRIYTDEQAMTTQENAVNTLRILQAQKVRTMTIVTSAYHQRWGQAVYNAIAAVYRQQRGYSVEIVGNYSFDTEPMVGTYRNDAEIAVRQIAGILELPSNVIRSLPQNAVPAAVTASPVPEEAAQPEEAVKPDEATAEPPEESAPAEEPLPTGENAGQAEAEAPSVEKLDYGDPDNWAYFADGEDRDVDVFLICPTVDTRSDRNAFDLNEKLKSRFVYALDLERGIFDETGRMFSPYYRQMSIKAYSLPEEEREQAKEIAYQDISAAFRWYLENENRDRGIILAGFSQGAELCLDLLKEYYGGERLEAQALQDRLVAVYAIGWRLTEEMTESYPQIVPACGEKDTGTVICFDCEDGTLTGTIIIPEGVKTMSINPLNWETDGTPADRSLNLGAVMGSDADPVPGLCGAYIGERGELVVTDVSAEDYPPGLDILPTGSFHLYDYMFFFTNLKDNVAERTEAWLRGQGLQPDLLGSEGLPEAA